MRNILESKPSLSPATAICCLPAGYARHCRIVLASAKSHGARTLGGLAARAVLLPEECLGGLRSVSRGQQNGVLATWIRLGINGLGTYVKAWIMLLCCFIAGIKKRRTAMVFCIPFVFLCGTIFFACGSVKRFPVHVCSALVGSPVFDICVLRLWAFGFKRHILQRESMLEIGSIEANRMKMLRPDLLVSAP